MSKTEVITIATTRGNFDLPAERVSGTEFVIWRYKNAPNESGFSKALGWSVTHAQTGRAIVAHAKSKAAAVSAWQAIEFAPKDGTEVDLWRPSYGGERLCDCRWVQLSPTNGFFEPIRGTLRCVRDATHFMLAPGPPL